MGHASAKAENISPVPPEEVATVAAVNANASTWDDIAYGMMAKQKVAFLIMGGGQGTRLGFDKAKGMYDILLPSRKSIFQLQAERLLKLHRLIKLKYPESDVRIPLYLMTSPLNHSETQQFFIDNQYFGLAKEDVFFFEQGTLPCFTPDGKVIMENKFTVSQAPDGNGGIYRSLVESGAFEDMEKRRIEYVHVSSVDNAIAKVADSTFIGFCQSRQADVGNKGCAKISWDERVGVMALKDGKYNIVEYSEIGDGMAQSLGSDGRLLYSTGNICNHLFSFAFLRDVAIPSSMFSYHVAHKKIPCANYETGETETPAEINGVKLEMFIFDVFPFAKTMGIMECTRSEEFSPVKNAPGAESDTPENAREMIMKLHTQWLIAAGGKVQGDAGCEISSLVSLLGEGLEAICSGMDEPFKTPGFICQENEVSSENVMIVSKPSSEVKISFSQNDSGIHIYQIS